jgi:hypothetical protein
MAQLDQQYNEVIKGSALREEGVQHESTEGFYAIPFGVDFKLLEYQYNGVPYIKASCSHCKTILQIESLNFVWKHCGMETPVPDDRNARLEARQIKKGLRKQSFLQRLTGKSEPVPQLNSF